MSACILFVICLFLPFPLQWRVFICLFVKTDLVTPNFYDSLPHVVERCWVVPSQSKRHRVSNVWRICFDAVNRINQQTINRKIGQAIRTNDLASFSSTVWLAAISSRRVRDINPVKTWDKLALTANSTNVNFRSAPLLLSRAERYGEVVPRTMESSITSSPHRLPWQHPKQQTVSSAPLLPTPSRLDKGALVYCFDEAHFIWQTRLFRKSHSCAAERGIWHTDHNIRLQANHAPIELPYAGSELYGRWHHGYESD